VKAKSQVKHFQLTPTDRGACRSQNLVWSRSWNGEKGEGATAVPVPQRSEGASFGQTIVCGAGGLFKLSEVSPGDYYIAAFDRLDRLFPSEALLNLVQARGTRLKVEALPRMLRCP
jgi:hypothetical protein